MTIFVVLYVAFIFASLGFCAGAAWATSEPKLPECPPVIPDWMTADA